MQMCKNNLGLMAVVLCAGVQGQALGGSPLGSAESFAVLGGTTVTNTGETVITGDLGVWPGTAVTGFPPGVLVGDFHMGDPVAELAHSDVVTAYDAFTAMPLDESLTGQDLGAMTLTPGVYFFSTSAAMTGTLTLDAEGDPLAVWIFQIGSTLTTSVGSAVVMTNGGVGSNVFWQVGSSATIGANTTFQGNIVALASITMSGGATILDGRALALNGAVTLDSNTIGTGSPAVCPWDCQATPSGDVGTADLLALLSQWGGAGLCEFDGNGVGLSDLVELVAQWGRCP